MERRPFTEACHVGANPSVRPPPPFPPNDEPASMATHQGKLIGEHQQSDRNHPEAQDRQEAENAAEDQHDADRNPEAARARHGELTAEDRYFPCRWMVVACCAHVWLVVRSGKVKAPADECRNHLYGSAQPSDGSYESARARLPEIAARKKRRKIRNASLQSRNGFAIGCATHMRASVPR